VAIRGSKAVAKTVKKATKKWVFHP
jgi:hypothetical protein